FRVRARDQSGNESPIVTVPVIVEDATPQIPDTHPLMDFRFEAVQDGIAYDSSPSRLLGLILGLVRQEPGVIGNALSFDGLTGFMHVPEPSLFNFEASESFSVSAWVRTPRNRAITSFIATGAGSFVRPGFTMLHLNHHESRLFVRLRDADGDDTGYVANNNGPAINDGEWHHVAAVIDRSRQTLVLYTDGIASDPVNLSAVGKDGIGDLSNNYGFSVGGPVFPFRGVIDEFKI